MIALHVQQIVSQHTDAVERMVGWHMHARGLWDGKAESMVDAARAMKGRIELREHRDQCKPVTVIVIDGARVCTVATSVELTDVGGLAAITMVGP
jgi:hypothetical protein